MILQSKISDLLQKYKDKREPDEILAQTRVIGPCDATIAKVNDRYRRILYIKNKDYHSLVRIKNAIEKYYEARPDWKKCYLTFDFDPMHGY